MHTQPSKSDRLTERMRRYASHDRLLLMRNFGYAGSAACLVILVSLTQVGAKDFALKVSVFSASIALPIWLLIGAIYEHYIFLGKQSYPHIRTKFFTVLVDICLYVAGLGMIGATGGIIYFLLPDAAYAFGVSVLTAFVLGVAFQMQLAHWWFRDGSPGAKDDKDNS